MTYERPLKLLAVAALVVALSLWSVLVFAQIESVAAVWPANAIVLVILLRACRSWPERGLMLASAFAGMLAANLLAGRDLVLSLGFPLADCAEIALAGWLLKDLTMPMVGVRAFAEFLLRAVVLAPLASSVIAAGVLALSGHRSDLAAEAADWVVADALGMAVWAPLGLSVQGLGWPNALISPRGLKLAGALALVAAATLVMFGQNQIPGAYFVFPLVVMAVFASPDLGGAAAIALVALISTTATALGHGPAVMATHRGVPLTPEIMVQAFLAIMVLTIHPVAAALRRLEVYAAEIDGRRARAELESVNKSKILAHVSHEIRTPLSGVVGLAQLMRAGAVGALTERQQTFVDKIAASGELIEILSRDLLDIAAVQAGKATPKIEPLAVSDAVAAALEAAAFRLDDLGVDVRVRPIEPGLRVRADAMRLRQVLMNLLVNAAKYGGRPGVVAVRAEPRGSSRVRICIEDNGQGIAPELRADLFKAFERLGAEGGQIEGTGVGLALCRELMQLQDGAIGVGESPLGGACFWIELPAAVAAVKAA